MKGTENVQKVISKLMDLKCEVERFREKNSLKDVKATLKTFVDGAEKEFKNFAGNDLHLLKKKFIAEKKHVESFVEKTLNDEMKKAKSFIKEQKTELKRVQKDLEKIVKGGKRPAKKSAKKRATVKRTVKVAKK